MRSPNQESDADRPQVVYEGPSEFLATDREPKPMRLRILCPHGLPEDAQVRLVIRNFGAFLRNDWSIDEIAVSGGGGRIQILHGLPQTFADLLAGGELPGGGGLIGGEQNHIYLCTIAVTEDLEQGTELCLNLRATMRSTAWLQGSLQVRLRLPGEAAFARIGDPIPLRSVAGDPERIEIRAKPMPNDEGCVRATVFVTDALGNPVMDYRAALSLNADGAMAGLPARSELVDGRAEIACIMPSGEAPARIHVQEAGAGYAATSPPILPGAIDGRRVYFGALHFHTVLSYDGDRDMSEAYAYARDWLNLDVIAAADHTPLEHRWDEMLRVNDAFYEPGRLVTLPAWECANFAGHVNVYLRSPDVDATPKLWNPDVPPGAIDWPEDVIAVPHHTNIRGREHQGKVWWDAYDWRARNPRVRLVEIVQGRGNFEADTIDPDWGIVTENIGSSVQDALAMGYRVGFVGGTDNHLGYPTRGGAAIYLGMTGFLAPALTREAIWQTMEERHTFATSGVPIVCLFEVNGAVMGSEYALARGEGVRFSAHLHGTAPIERMEVISDRRCVWRTTPNQWDVVLKDVPLPAPEGPSTYYYLRLRQADGHRAWASPVWADSL